MTPFMMATTSSITMQSLGKIVQRAPAVGAKTWCLFCCLFVCCFFVTLRVRSAVRSRGAYFEHALRCVYRSISTRFAAFFSEWIALSDKLHSSHIRR